MKTWPSSLAGKKGLILGLTNDHSIAWGCAREARMHGAEVVVSCLNETAYKFVEPLARELEVPLYCCNVEQPEALESFIEKALLHLGPFDFVIHAIAWAPLEDLQGTVLDCSGPDFARAMQISCYSFAQIAKLCAPYMPNGGSFVTINYLGAIAAVPHYGLMGPIKAALESMVKYLAMELGPKKLRGHAVSPGLTLTRAPSGSGIEVFDQMVTNARHRAPLGRLVTLEEVARPVIFLCSDAASGMTGQTIYVDAGCHAVAS